MSEKFRVPKWDNLKFFLILCVVVGHFIERYIGESWVYRSLFVFIYSFHMPAFLFIAGLFSKRTVDTNNVKKVLPYITLYFSVKILLFAVRACCTGETYASFLSEAGLPWFMLSLFFMYIITMYTKRFKTAWVLIGSVALSVFAGYAIQKNGDFLTVLRTINFYPFFYLGYILKPDELAEKLDKPKVKIASAVLIVALAAVCFVFTDKVFELRFFLTGRNPYGSYSGLIRLALFVVSTVEIFALISLTPSKRSAFTTLGSRTLAVYCTHYCFIYILFDVFDLKGALARAIPSAWHFALIAVGVLITFICSNKWFDKGVGFLMNYKIKLKKE